MRKVFDKTFRGLVLSLVLALGPAGFALAQTGGTGTNTGTTGTTGTSSTTGTSTSSPTARSDDYSRTDRGSAANWGWLGLVGLVGLIGLMRGTSSGYRRNTGDLGGTSTRP